MKKVFLSMFVLGLMAAGCSGQTNQQPLGQTPPAQSQNKTVSLADQQKCAESSAAFFKDNRIVGTQNLPSPEFAEYTNYYNQAFGKCFILIHSSAPELSLFNDGYFLIDIFQNKVIAYINTPAPNYSQPKPGCNTSFFVNYDTIQCSDKNSFDSFVKPYINN